jgi:hypothetical protein
MCPVVDAGRNAVDELERRPPSRSEGAKSHLVLQRDGR